MASSAPPGATGSGRTGGSGSGSVAPGSPGVPPFGWRGGRTGRGGAAFFSTLTTGAAGASAAPSFGSRFPSRLAKYHRVSASGTATNRTYPSGMHKRISASRVEFLVAASDGRIVKASSQ